MTKNTLPLASAMRDFITDEQLLECLILFETSKMDAAKLMIAYMGDKWSPTTLQAVRILENLSQEFKRKI